MYGQEISGIILRKQPGGEAVQLYTASEGRIIVSDWRRGRRAKSLGTYPAGTLIHGTLSRAHGSFGIVDISDAEFASENRAISDFYWIQHLLELYYYFVPLGQPCEELYALLAGALSASRSLTPCEQRSVFIMFYLALGEAIPDPVITAATRCMSDDILKNICSGDYHYEDSVDTWLVWFVSAHPYGKLLNTEQFFPQIYPKSRFLA